VNLLLDTHALLWWLDDSSLAPGAREAIADPENLVAVSAASVWEIEIKRALGKLDAPAGIVDAVRASEFEPLPIALEHAELAGGLPDHHRDPFDRMLVAQATLLGLTVVTRDPAFTSYAVGVLVC